MRAWEVLKVYGTIYIPGKITKNTLSNAQKKIYFTKPIETCDRRNCFMRFISLFNSITSIFSICIKNKKATCIVLYFPLTNKTDDNFKKNYSTRKKLSTKLKATISHAHPQ